jgi:hypothetical protein
MRKEQEEHLNAKDAMVSQRTRWRPYRGEATFKLQKDGERVRDCAAATSPPHRLIVKLKALRADPERLRDLCVSLATFAVKRFLFVGVA